MVALTAALSTPVLAEKKKRGAGKEKNFVSLFEGTSTDQWMNAKSGKFPEKGWVIEDRCLKHRVHLLHRAEGPHGPKGEQADRPS